MLLTNGSVGDVRPVTGSVKLDRLLSTASIGLYAGSWVHSYRTLPRAGSLMLLPVLLSVPVVLADPVPTRPISFRVGCTRVGVPNPAEGKEYFWRTMAPVL